MRHRLKYLIALAIALCCPLSQTLVATTSKEDQALRLMIAQKLMLDVRYFSTEGKPAPVTELPPELAEAIGELGIGGVILFSENLQTPEQILKLNRDLMDAAERGGHGPLFIAVDQEGGRVVRLPRNHCTALPGNMAIGATYPAFGDYFAIESGKILATELLSLGFNVNFAPTVDVNINPRNPVINVRSFGEDADMVSVLGTAQMNAMQQAGIIATLKHFPGHGDTTVDSHTGLPRVQHNRSTVEAVDLKPFRYAIEHGSPSMIMAAHIQYPQLDSTEIPTRTGEQIPVPATMSRKILTDLLRGDMGYQGVIISDALDMKSISDYFGETEAVIHCFEAGCDIALIPMKLRSPADIPRLETMIDAVVRAVQTGRLNQGEIAASVARIQALKLQYHLDTQDRCSPEDALAQAERILGCAEHRKVEQDLADHCIVVLKNNGAFPLSPEIRHIHLNMPDTTKATTLATALREYLPEVDITCGSQTAPSGAGEQAQMKLADVLIVGDITPAQSLVEFGGMDDLHSLAQLPPKELQIVRQRKLLSAAKAQNKTTIFISLRAPYNVGFYAEQSNAILATFAYNVDEIETNDSIPRCNGAIYRALAKLLSGQINATGTLPVSIEE
ncbi:MAG: hypothetical protein JW739_05845 [Opitutales bacterium]|nr:hypothetical protein [Opitutales bacterium]